MSNQDGDYQQLRQLRFQQLLQSLQRIPDGDKVELVEALERAPNLVQLESDPMKFLQRDNFDFDAAARRLASYWRYRKQFFGERAFLPMTLFGDGALNSDDVAAYMKGYQTILPDHPSGKAVLFTDRVNLSRLDLAIHRRICFYNFQLLSEKDCAISPGFISFVLLDSFAFTDSDMKVGLLVMEALPISMLCVQIIVSPDGSPLHNLLVKFSSLMVCIFGTSSVARNSKFLLANSLGEKRNAALSLGFRQQDIPDSIGGMWNFDSFSYWLQERLIVETERYAGCIDTFTLPSNVPDDTKPSAISVPQARTQKGFFPDQILPTNVQASPMQQQQIESLLRLNQIEQLMGFQTNLCPQNPSLNTQMPSTTAPAAHGEVGGFPTVLPYAKRDESSDKTSCQAFSENLAVPHDSSEKKPEAFQSKDLIQSTKSKTLEEVYELLNLGSKTAIRETDEILNISRSRFNEALRAIPEKEKVSYLEALRTAPDLVRRESNPLFFIRAEHYDSWAAARRMINYWNVRKKLFGNRAFLPMIQTGYGALTRDDVVAFSSGAIALLPNDSCGRAVLCSDRSKILNTEDEKTSGSLLRGLFYLATVLAENETNQREGIIVVLNVIPPRFFEFKQETLIDRAKLMKCTPVWLKAFHLVVCPPKSGKRNLAEQIVQMVTKLAGSYHGKKAILHTGSSIEEIQLKLEEFGLLKENLPSSMGGTWKYEEFTKWQRNRSQEEQSTHRASKAQELLPPVPPTEASAPLSSEDKKARKRKLNIIHSRQKRERRRAEVEEIKKRCTDLEERNDALRKENSRFEGILQEVTAKLSLHYGGIVETSIGIPSSSAQPGFCQSAPANFNSPDFQQMTQIQPVPVPMTGLFSPPNQFFNDNIAFSAGLPVQQQLSHQAGVNFGNIILPTQQHQGTSCTTNQNQIYPNPPQNDRLF